jgi:hypothetical protein
MFDSEGSNGASNSAGSSSAPDAVLTLTRDGHQHERTIVAQWLHAHPERVRVLEVESAEGLSMPAVRIPQLTDLCGPATEAEALAS